MHSIKVFLMIVVTALIHPSVSAQNQRYNGDDKHLRMCIRWNDSTEYQTPFFTNSHQTVYTFERVALSWGIYEKKEIYIATNKSSLNQFNRERKLGRDYHWTLRKSEHTIDGYPIYEHRGNF